MWIFAFPDFSLTGLELKMDHYSHDHDQVRGEERVEEEQRRSRELMQRLERERQLEVHTLINLAMLTIVTPII